MSNFEGGVHDVIAVPQPLSAYQALVRIHDVMSGSEWSADTLDYIADILGLTELGRPTDADEEES